MFIGFKGLEFEAFNLRKISSLKGISKQFKENSNFEFKIEKNLNVSMFQSFRVSKLRVLKFQSFERNSDYPV